MTIHINDEIRLELTAQKHVADLYEAVDCNRTHLSTFLPWVRHMQTMEDMADYVKQCESLHADGKEVSFVIIANKSVLGRVGLHHVNTLR